LTKDKKSVIIKKLLIKENALFSPPPKAENNRLFCTKTDVKELTENKGPLKYFEGTLPV